MTRRIWLVRHGETAGQSSVRYHGSNDVPLAESGRAQIRALVPWVRGVAFGRVLHSPLSRAVESARILVEGCGLPADLLVADERLREISFGDCEGMTRQEIEVAFPGFWQRHLAGETDGFPGGESRTAFAERVGEAARSLVSAPWTGDVLVVGHRGTVRYLLREVLGYPADVEDPFAVELGSLTVVRQEVGEPGYQVELLGVVP